MNFCLIFVFDVLLYCLLNSLFGLLLSTEIHVCWIVQVYKKRNEAICLLVHCYLLESWCSYVAVHIFLLTVYRKIGHSHVMCFIQWPSVILFYGKNTIHCIECLGYEKLLNKTQCIYWKQNLGYSKHAVKKKNQSL